MTCVAFEKTFENKLFLTAETKILNLPAFAEKIVASFFKEDAKDGAVSVLKAEIGIPDAVKKEIPGFADKKGSFVIKTVGDTVTVYADSDEAAVNGIMTLLHRISEKGYIDCELIWDYPLCEMRGIKLMMPAKDQIDDFKAFIDMMVYYRHNTVMIEIGGAMEYKLHPEINEGWVEYCQDMFEYEGKNHVIQEGTFLWRKNSIHTNNGGGSWLTQKQIKEDIIDYCAERGVEIIPEVPCTSHCDYMLTRHPEIAERVEDPYPDTFCPSNPDSYKLLFDMFDEIIDLFKPRIINIGHDEYYNINVCDRCRKRLMDAADIFAEDVIKIYDYLASKNVKTMLWCDKMLDTKFEDDRNHNFGGACCYFRPLAAVDEDFHIVVPSTWRSRAKLPRDLICLHWLWSFGAEYDKDLAEFPMAFGNFWGSSMRDYHARVGENYLGSICSNWGGMKWTYLQRNRIYLCLAYNDILYFDKKYDSTDDTAYGLKIDDCFASLYNYKKSLSKSKNAPIIEFTHTTDKYLEYHKFSDGIYAEGEEYENSYVLGEYIVTYTDGEQSHLPVVLGENVANCNIPWYGKKVELKSTSDAPGGGETGIDNLLAEVAYSTLPQVIDGKIYYSCFFENEHPEKTISDITFKLREDADWTVTTKAIKY